jgi:hypothetical protein
MFFPSLNRAEGRLADAADNEFSDLLKRYGGINAATPQPQKLIEMAAEAA